jgi:ribosomal protein L37AE/L43A
MSLPSYNLSSSSGLKRIYAASEPGRIKRIKLRTGQPLMENIVRLAEYRKRRGKQPRPAAVPSDHGAQYFCTRCDSDEFRLSAAGMVHCAHCSALMRNLFVTPSPSPSQEAG